MVNYSKSWLTVIVAQPTVLIMESLLLTMVNRPWLTMAIYGLIYSADHGETRQPWSEQTVSHNKVWFIVMVAGDFHQSQPCQSTMIYV